MPDWIILIVLGIFLIHLYVFGKLAIERRELYYIVVTFTFIMLVIAFTLRLWAPGLEVGGYSPFWTFRIAAWCSTAVSLTLYTRRKLQARTQAQRARVTNAPTE